MLSFPAAQGLVLQGVRPLASVDASLDEALGRVLAQDVVAQEALPPFLNSAMDGFAVRWEDLPGPLRILADQPAGTLSGHRVGPGIALRIMTGAVIPEGADTVVPVEHVDVADGLIRVQKPIRRGANLRQAGEDVPLGECVLRAGRCLRASDIGLLAALGQARVWVIPAPRVAILTTGDELVDVASPLGPAQIRDANIHALCAQVKAAGAIPVPIPRVPDRPEALEAALRHALAQADVICTNGGVSMGEWDHVRAVLASMGAQEQFWQVAQKPGRPMVFDLWEGRPVFGLPGNPVAAQVCFELYVRPVLRKLMGFETLFRPTLAARLAEPMSKPASDRRTHFLRVCLADVAGQLMASSTGPQGSGLLTSMTRADALLVLPEDAVDPQAGDPVTVFRLEAPEQGG